MATWRKVTLFREVASNQPWADSGIVVGRIANPALGGVRLPHAPVSRRTVSPLPQRHMAKCAKACRDCAAACRDMIKNV
jgi:hypothetical protein